MALQGRLHAHSRPLRVTVIDLVTGGFARGLFGRVMDASLTSVMPQAVAVWCEELGHSVRYVCDLGDEEIAGALLRETDVVIIGAFTRAALFAYALANLYAKGGAVTVLGGPHARCYPEDAAKYFDYVLGFTGKAEIAQVLGEAAPRRGPGRFLSAVRQPSHIPGVRQRWKFIEATLRKAPVIKIVPMLGSTGCPYTCAFCIDAPVRYQPFDLAEIQEDLRFVRARTRRPIVGWHDPNFGIRFDEVLGAIEAAVPPGGVRFVAETSLALLTERNLQRLRKNGFIGLLPGIESWYDYGNKSKAARTTGAEKLRQIADHVNLILRHVPFVQTNFILGLDCDEGDEPFELTKRFLDLVPGAFPAFSLFTCYGRAAPLNLELQRAGRVRPFPFALLDSNRAMNVQPLHYSWEDFYDRAVDLNVHALSVRGLLRRFLANRGFTTKALNLVRGGSSTRVQYQSEIHRMLKTDAATRRYFAGESDSLPPYYEDRIRSGLGRFWEALPAGALAHDQNAYLHSAEPAPRLTAAG